MPIDLVPMTLEHVAAFHRALDAVARERRYLALLEAPPLEEMHAYVLGRLEKGDPRILAVADDAVVGWCDVTRDAVRTQAHRGRLGMGVVPGFRRQGLGLRLLTTTLDAAWSAGFTRIELGVYGDNAAAIALYERAGFVREGIVRDAICIDGHYRDAIAMAIIRR